MRRIVVAALLMSVLSVSQAQENISKPNGAVRVTADKPVGNVAGTNGSVSLEDGAQAKNVQTVNGAITIGRSATVGSVKSVNGKVDVSEDTRAEAIETVNGGVSLAERVQVERGVKAVNGRIQLARSAAVGGSVETTNGSIQLDHANVGGDVRTKNGNVDVGPQSIVKGGILVEKSDSDWGESKRLPRIVIGPGAVVSGPLTFEREVELYVSESAKVGPITGAKAIKFSGDRPSATMSADR
jgi:DUF4097 and DUF4098 domain-containing protein YvlB